MKNAVHLPPLFLTSGKTIKVERSSGDGALEIHSKIRIMRSWIGQGEIERVYWVELKGLLRDNASPGHDLTLRNFIVKELSE